VVTCPETVSKSLSEHFPWQWTGRRGFKIWPPQSLNLILSFVSNGLHKPSDVKSENQQDGYMKLNTGAAVETVYK
jgi:hypothetical protein